MNFKKKVNGSWTDTPHYVHKTDTDTITTFPAVIYPNAATATVGLKGNMSQTGTPTSDNPIQPSECGERTGNLCLVSQNNCITYANFANYVISNNSITSTGQALLGFKCKVESNTSYTISIKKNTSADLRIREYSSEPTDWTTDFVIQSLNTNQTSATFTTSQDTKWILVAFWFSTAGHTVYDIMLNLGSTPLPYEPYGYKIPISSANTTTPVYLGEVETTRKIKKHVFTGEESWSVSSSQGKTRAVANFTTSIGIVPLSKVVSTHYIGVEGGAGYPNINTITVNNNGTMIIGISSEFTSKETWKSYLAQQYAAGTPVTVWYVLATPETAVVNEPLRKIGDYADEVSGISIPVTAGANTLDVQTTVQPSEVTAGFSGWHTGTVYERESGQWD